MFIHLTPSSYPLLYLFHPEAKETLLNMYEFLFHHLSEAASNTHAVLLLLLTIVTESYTIIQ